MSQYILKASVSETGNQFALALSDVVKDAPKDMRAGVLLKFDIGFMHPDMKGHLGAFLELPTSFDSVDCKVLEDGMLEFVTSIPNGYNTITDLCEEWAQETEDTIQDMYEASTEDAPQLGGNVTLEVTQDPGYEQPLVISLPDEPQWLQSMTSEDHGVSDDDWKFLGQLTSDYYFGTIFAFYNREAKLLRNIFECT